MSKYKHTNLCEKVKTQVNSTMCYSHIFFYFLHMPQIVIFLDKTLQMHKIYNIIYVYDLFIYF
jgi:hypothetical protein